MNKKQQGDYYRNIIGEIEDNLADLEIQILKWGRFRKFLFGINRNRRIRTQQLTYYKGVLAKAIREKWAE